mgnify:CR=1 FL=1
MVIPKRDKRIVVITSNTRGEINHISHYQNNLCIHIVPQNTLSLSRARARTHTHTHTHTLSLSLSLTHSTGVVKFRALHTAGGGKHSGMSCKRRARMCACMYVYCIVLYCIGQCHHHLTNKTYRYVHT